MASSLKTVVKKTVAKKNMEQLVEELKNSPSEKVRYNAARMLGEMGDPAAVDALIESLRHEKNGSVRLYAARALGELGDPLAVHPLIEALTQDRNVDVKVRAARALGRLGGEDVVLPLIYALSDVNSQVCMTAADALIEIGPIAAKPLIQSLKHDKVNVRCDATRALGELGDTCAVEPLIDMLDDEWVNVRIYAVQSLGKLQDSRAVQALVDVMNREDENILVRSGAAASLGMIKDPKALIPLRSLIMGASELGELEDTALKAYKMIMAAVWKSLPASVQASKKAAYKAMLEENFI
jgi:HEAT repeat protein